MSIWQRARGKGPPGEPPERWNQVPGIRRSVAHADEEQENSELEHSIENETEDPENLPAPFLHHGGDTQPVRDNYYRPSQEHYYKSQIEPPITSVFQITY